MNDQHLTILLEMKESMGSLHAKVDALTDRLDSHEALDDEAHTRIASLETTRSEVKGGYAVLLVAVAVVTSLLTVTGYAWVVREPEELESRSERSTS